MKPPITRRASQSPAGVADLAGALHEVSNSLTVVLGWLDAARDKIPEGPGLEAVEVALAHARFGHTVARRAIGAEVPDPAAARSALAVAQDAALGVAREAYRLGVTVELQDRIQNDLLLHGAPFAQQILINLLLNAVHFSRESTSVDLVVEGDATMAHFRIIDHGPGIAQERVGTLFTAPESTRPGGAGIGLRHAHALTVKHGGSLRVARTGPDGTEFELVWPIVGAPSSSSRSVPPRVLEGLRVLLLEDDTAVQNLVELGLTARGAEVSIVSNARDLISNVLSGIFDVALVDLSPLGHRPAETLALLGERQPAMSVILISGSVAPDVETPDVAAWVRKPFEIGELVQTILRVRA